MFIQFKLKRTFYRLLFTTKMVKDKRKYGVWTSLLLYDSYQKMHNVHGRETHFGHINLQLSIHGTIIYDDYFHVNQ